MPALAQIVPAATTNATNVCARTPFKLLVAMDNGTTAVVAPARRIQPGSNVSSLC